MNILITGATGGLGQNACEIAHAQGHHVIAIGRNTNILAQLQTLGMQTVTRDLARSSLDDGLFDGVDTVWHCAALSSPWGAYDDFYAINVRATQHIMEQAGRAGVPFVVHISTPSLYFDYQHHHNVHESYQPKQYVNHYAHTKALAEQVVQQAVKSYPNTQYVMLRPRAIFGKYDTVLIPRLLNVIENKGFLPLPNAGRAVMDFTFVENVVHAMFCATKPLTSGDVFNITNHEPMVLKDVLNQLFNTHLQLNFKIKSIPYPVLYHLAKALEWRAKWTHQEPMLTQYGVGALRFDMILDNHSAKQTLGYTPQVDMEQAIKKTADWIRGV